MKCEFSFDDGAYVLGALAPSERAAFERHLARCPQCRDAVAALAVLPGLLGRLDATTAIPAVAAPPSLLRRTLSSAASRRRAERRRRGWATVAAGLVTAVIATGVGFGVHLADTSVASPAALSEMHQVDDHSPVSAEIGLTATEGGSRVIMTCRYAEGYEGRWVVRLVVFPRWGGMGEQIATWTAVAGQEIPVNALTHLTPDEVGRVEVQRSDATPLLTWYHT